jgi:ABC-type dipeptide/oligopeptide/nickel transport system permease component
VEAAFGRDIPLLLGIAAAVTAMVVAASTAADFSYGLLDPRIRSS